MNQDKIWDYFQNDDRGIATFRVALPRYSFVAKQIPKHGSVLNIGVGSGGLETLLHAAGREVFSVDPSEKTITALSARLGWPAGRARVGYSQALPFGDQCFDVVVMSEVLEHLPDDVLTSTLSEVARVLKPGGRFMGTVPADEDLHAETVVCPACGDIHHRWGHLQRFSADRLGCLVSSKFHAVVVQRVMFRMGSHLNWKGRLAWLAKRLALAIGIHGKDETLYFHAIRQ